MVLPLRKKNYAQKVRSGCQCCKKRHLKCDEGKPGCVRCRKAGLKCVYNVPKPLLFERSGPLNCTKSAEHEAGAITTRVPISINAWDDPKAGQSMQYYLTETGPWLSRYVPRQEAFFWKVLVPRFVRSLPACQHLMMAFVGIEQRFFTFEPSAVTARANQIVKQYNTALQILTSPDKKPHILDLLISPLLCWMIEMMTNNQRTARMHLDAAQRILETYTDPSAGHTNTSDSETEDALPLIRRHIAYCRGYSATSAACGGIFDDEPITLVKLMATRYTPTPDYNLRSPQVRAAIRTYTARLDPVTGHTPLSPPEALRYLRFWEHTIWCRRFTDDEAIETVTATCFLIAVVVTLLADQGGRDFLDADERTDDVYSQTRAFEYMLLRFDDLLATPSTVKMSDADRKGMLEAVGMGADLIARFAVDDENARRAREMLKIVRKQSVEFVKQEVK